jgi:hypothetical protein
MKYDPIKGDLQVWANFASQNVRDYLYPKYTALKYGLHQLYCVKKCAKLSLTADKRIHNS